MSNFSLIAETKDFSNLEVKKFHQKKYIVELIYKNGKLSAPEISKLTGISVPTISKLINELIKADYLCEVGTGKSIGGRKPTLFDIKNDSCFILGIDLGWRSTRIGIFTIKNEQFTDIITLPYGAYNDKEKALTESIREAVELMEKNEINQDKLIGVGLAMTGLINSNENINYTHYKSYSDSLLDIFKETFNVPIYLLNDSKANAMGERYFGKAKEVDNAICINLNMGLGAGLIFNGELYNGKSGFSGEFGHMKLKNNNKLCNCGKQGCAETEVSGNALLKNITNLIKEGYKSVLTTYVDDVDKINLEHIIEAVNKEDELAIQELSKMGSILGEALSSLLHLLNPEKVILCGKLALTGEYLLTAVMNSLNVSTIQKIRKDTEIVVSNIIEKACLLGCVARVIEKTFEKDKNNIIIS
jgi:predicted NBD/HSP70 family sugar kinase